MCPVKDEDIARLYELADLIHGIGRQLRAPADLEPGPCTPVEVTVMRNINQHPGTTARVAAEATLLRSSNLSRVLRELEQKGLVRRESNLSDARSVRLYPTSMAGRNLKRLRDVWSQSLQGIIHDPKTIDSINTTLHLIEKELIERRRLAEESGG